MVKQRRFIGNTNNKMINIREYLQAFQVKSWNIYVSIYIVYRISERRVNTRIDLHAAEGEHTASQPRRNRSRSDRRQIVKRVRCPGIQSECKINDLRQISEDDSSSAYIRVRLVMISICDKSLISHFYTILARCLIFTRRSDLSSVRTRNEFEEVFVQAC